MSLTYRLSAFGFSVLGALALSACQTGDDPTLEDFISDDPASSGGSLGDDGDEGGASTGGDPGDGGDDNGGDGVDVSEADIIQIEGDRLYALSSFSGLTVVDMQDPDNLRALGTWETDAQPFEMYVDSGRAFIMFNDYGFWHWNEADGYWDYQSSSRLVALDAANPANIQVRGEFTLPGRIQDSRRVGDVLYLVTMEDGWCWSCSGEQKTVVTSLDISDEANPKIVDQLEFVAENNNWDWQRSVDSTSQRMYIAARTWAWQGMGSYIDVVDISAGDGTLVPGAQVPVTGSVFSRWQMNEHQGVLRVISQLGWTDDPLVETFTIESSDSIVPLGVGSLAIPEPESLRSARFDGDRAYAITAEETDPLFTIDLSDPANPQQVGELEIPGWVYHMETRGDRILALGFDPAHPEGSLNVSLFDVSDFAAPALRKRVHFGGDWASFAEDQNRIHKAFTILDDEHMLLVPHTGWDWSGNYECSSSFKSGVQIVDWLDDDLTLRGLVPARGSARRAFTHKNRIMTVSDSQLASFDYADRDNPQARDSLALAVNVEHLVKTDAVWVRMSRNWWTSEQMLEIVDAADPGSPEPLGLIDLAGISDCAWAWVEGLYAVGDHVFVVRNVSSWDGDYDYSAYIEIISVDVSDPSNPIVVDIFEIDGWRSWSYNSLANIVTSSNWMVQHGNHLAFLVEDKQGNKPQIKVVDVSEPGNIQLTATLERPAGQTQGQLSVLSDQVVSWHTEPVEGQPGKVRFYFDRLNLGAQPSWAPKINVPGVIVAYDSGNGRAFTVDFKISTANLSPNDCFGHPKYWRFEWDNENGQTGTCKLIERTLKQLAIGGNSAALVATIDLEGDAGIQQFHASDSRLFARIGANSWYGDDSQAKLTIVDTTAGVAQIHEIEGSQLGQWWWLTAVDGARALVGGAYGDLTLVDSSTLTQPTILHSKVPGWGGCYRPVIDGDTVYCPMGAYGLATVEW